MRRVSLRSGSRCVLGALGVAIALAVSGCGLRLPATAASAASSPSARADTPNTGVVNPAGTVGCARSTPTGAVNPAGTVGCARSTPASAVEELRRFVLTYINWDAADVAARLRVLAQQSVGQARSALELEAAETSSDPELRRAGVSNSGAVEAIAPLSAQAGRYVVVTREQTTSSNSDAYAGLGPEWHLALATVTRAPVAREAGAWRWAVSEWQPQS